MNEKQNKNEKLKKIKLREHFSSETEVAFGIIRMIRKCKSYFVRVLLLELKRENRDVRWVKSYSW